MQQPDIEQFRLYLIRQERSVAMVKKHIRDARCFLHLQMVRESYGEYLNVFKAEIPREIRIAEASAYGQSIYEYDPKGKAVEAFEGLVGEGMGLSRVQEQSGSLCKLPHTASLHNRQELPKDCRAAYLEQVRRTSRGHPALAAGSVDLRFTKRNNRTRLCRRQRKICYALHTVSGHTGCYLLGKAEICRDESQEDGHSEVEGQTPPCLGVPLPIHFRPIL